MRNRRVVFSCMCALLACVVSGYGAVEDTSTNQTVTYQSAAEAFDWTLYNDTPRLEEGIPDLVGEYESDQFELLGIAVPDPDLPVRRSPRRFVISRRDFPRDFIRGLVPVMVDGVKSYPVQVGEDNVTRERFVINASGEEIARIPASDQYDPLWFLYWRYAWVFDSSFQPRNAPDRGWYLQVYDPARIESSFTLRYENEHIAWVTLQGLNEQQFAARAASAGGGTRSLGDPVTNLEFGLIGGGASGVTVTVTYPDSYTNRVDIFYCTDFMAQDWSLGTCTNISALTNFIAWTDGAGIPVGSTRFYHIGNADYDEDSDGLAYGREVLIYSSDPTQSDTDGDQILDGWEASNETMVCFADAWWDADGDGLTVELEYRHGTDPYANDTDGDGMPDGWEIAHCLQPDVADGNLDSDGDGVVNTQEYANGTHPMAYSYQHQNMALVGNFGDHPWSTTENPMFLVSNNTWCAYVNWQAQQTYSIKFIANAQLGWSNNLPEWGISNALTATQYCCPVVSQPIDKGWSVDGMVDIQVNTGPNSGLFCLTLYQVDNTFSVEQIDEIPPYTPMCETYRVPGTFNGWTRYGTGNLMYENTGDTYVTYQELPDTVTHEFEFADDHSSMVVWGDNQQTSSVPPYQGDADLGYDTTNILLYSSPPGLYEITLNGSNKAYSVKYIETDQDADGLTDMQEILDWSTEPLTADTDGDGMNDGDEVDQQYDPTAFNAAATVTVLSPEDGRRLP